MYRHLAFILLLIPGFTFALATPAAQPDQTASGRIELAPSELRWMPAPPVLPKGVQLAVLRGNPLAEGFCTLRLKIPPHTVFAPHWHPTTESFTVLSGTLHIGMGDTVDKTRATALPPMGFASMPAMHHHYVYTGDQAVIIDLSFYGPFQIHYVHPGDDPSRKGAAGR